MAAHEAGDNRRESPRFKSGLVVKYRKPDGSDTTSLSRVVNVSEGGLQIVCHDFIKVNTVLELSIGGAHGENPVSLAGKVVWIHPAPDVNGAYYSGVRFEDIGEDARAIILSQLG